MLTRCAACGKQSKNSTDVHLVRCPICLHYQFRFQLSERKYDQSYLNEYKRRAETDLGRKITKLRWSLVQNHVSYPQSRILDWGCGVGNFVEACPDSYIAEGYDINPHSGYESHDLYDEWWAGVTLWDVIEHLFRPDLFLRHLKSEYVFIATPNATGLNSLEGWRHYKPDEHQHYFNGLSLSLMMLRAGYKVITANYNEGELRDPEHKEAILTMVGRRD